MFTGIVEEKAKVKRITKARTGCKLSVASKTASKDSKAGDSISVNGICLTIIDVKENEISFDVMKETLERTNLKNISAGDSINLERPLKANGRLSGHFVTGHIDCAGKILSIAKRPNDCAIDIEFPKDKAAYAVEKGSVAIDGVSLTIAEVKGSRMRVYLIPLTLKATNIGYMKSGDLVNIEFDILGKYALKGMASIKGGIDADFLKKHGFL